MQADAALTFATVPALLAEAAAVVDAGELDLGGVRQIDSAGLSALLELTRRTRSKGRTLRLRRAPPAVQSLASFFKVAPLLHFAD